MSIQLPSSPGEVSLICGYLEEDPRAIRGYLTFLQTTNKSDRYNFANWVIRHVLTNPPVALEARLIKATLTPAAAAAVAPTEPQNFKLPLSQSARIRFVRQLALFAAETADLEVLDYSLTSLSGNAVMMRKAINASVNALAASSSVCGTCRVMVLEHLFENYRPTHFLAVVLKSLENESFVNACFASPVLGRPIASDLFAISISAACSGLSTLASLEDNNQSRQVNTALGEQPNLSSRLFGVFHRDAHFHMAKNKIEALKQLFKQDIEKVLTTLAQSGDARCVEILLNLEDVKVVRVDIQALIIDGHANVLRVVLDHPKFRKTCNFNFHHHSAGLPGLINLAAREDHVEVLRVLLAVAKKYQIITIDVFAALKNAILNQQTENVQELLQFEKFNNSSLMISLIETALNMECVGIEIFFLLLRSAQLAQNEFENLFKRHLELPELKLLMADPRFAAISVENLKPILNYQQDHRVLILATYPHYKSLTIEQLNELARPVGQFLDLLKATNRLDEITVNSVYDAMLRLVKEVNADGVARLQTLTQTPQFEKFESHQLIKLYQAAAKRKTFPEYFNFLIQSPRFQNIDFETLGQELINVTKFVVFEGSDIALAEMQLGSHLENNMRDMHYVTITAPRIRAGSASILKMMMKVPRMLKISQKHLLEFIELAKKIKDQALLVEVVQFVSRFPKDSNLDLLQMVHGLLKAPTEAANPPAAAR